MGTFHNVTAGSAGNKARISSPVQKQHGLFSSFKDLLQIPLQLQTHIKAAGYDVTTPLIVTNTDDYEEVKMLAEGTVNNSSEVLEVK